MNEFDIKASGWDQNQMHWARSLAVAGQIREHIPLTKQMSALEFGPGTGIIRFILRQPGLGVLVVGVPGARTYPQIKQRPQYLLRVG